IQRVFIKKTSTSLYDIIRRKSYTAFDSTVGREAWISLMPPNRASLQQRCNREGFNNASKIDDHNYYAKVRIGIIANQETNCSSADSYLGVGGIGSSGCSSDRPLRSHPSGNSARCYADNGDRDTITMSYIFVR
ncbi:MAG: hypothetical protein AAGJ35_09275, partial [Myxococcota bacterium]